MIYCHNRFAGYVIAQVEAHVSENTFVETKIINIGLSCLNGKGVAVVVGPPGTGKTRNSLELLRKYTEQHTDFGMIQLHEPSLFGKLIRSDDRLVVLFDDVFGKTNCCFNEDVHMKDLDMIYSYVKRGFIKVILTMRNTIKKMCVHTIRKHRLFETCNLLDLALQSHQMNQRQKMECIRKYCAKFNVKETEITTVKGDKSMEIATLSTTQICEIARVDNNPLLGFPESCYLFTSNFMFIKQGSIFFRHPTRNLCDEINNLRVSGQKDMISRRKYVTLVYVLLNGGYLDPYDIDRLMIDLILTSIYRFSSEICNCAVLVDSAKTMTGIYLKIDSSGKYSFQHRIIFESVLLSYADVKIESIIPLMKFDFILEMLRPQEFEANEGEVVLLLPEKCYPLLASRLISILKKDFLLIPDRFVQMLCGSRIIVLTGTKLISSICFEYERSDCDRFIRNERLTSGHFNLRSLHRHFYLPAGLLNTITICNGNESAVKYLLEYIKSRRNLDRLSRNAVVCYLFTAIANACQFHRENVLLVLGKIEFSRFKLYNISLNEYFLAREFDMNSWKMLLDNFGSLRDCEWFDVHLAIKSALESAFLYMDKNFIDYISFTYGKKTVDLNYFLNFACQNGKEIVVRWIFEQFETNHIDIIAPLLSVCRKGNKELVVYLLRKCCIEDLNLNATMQAACESGTLDVVTMLWEKFNFDIFDVESCFKSSCRKGNLNIVKWLYESFDKALCHDISVLNLACISSNIELVEYLIINFLKTSDNEMTKIEECSSYCNSSMLRFFVGKYGCDLFDLDHILSVGLSENNAEFVIWSLTNFDSKSVDLSNAVKLACQNGNFRLVNYFLETFDKESFDMKRLLFAACTSGETRLVEWFLNSNCYESLELQEASNVSCARGKIDVVIMLHKRYNEKACNVKAAVNSACFSGSIETVYWLLNTFQEKDADLDVALAMACGNGKNDLVMWLLEKYDMKFDMKLAILETFKASLKKERSNGKLSENSSFELLNWMLKECGNHILDIKISVLLACKQGKIGHVKWLFDKFSETCRDINPSEALEAACHGFDTFAIYLFLVKRFRNRKFDLQTVMQYACEFGNDQIVEDLLKRFDKNKLNVREGIFAACLKGHLNVLRVLWLYAKPKYFREKRLVNLVSNSENSEMVNWLIAAVDR